MTTRKMAEQYIREQLDIIRKHGGTPRLTPEQRREAIASTQRTFDTMRDSASSESHEQRRKPLHA